MVVSAPSFHAVTAAPLIRVAIVLLISGIGAISVSSHLRALFHILACAESTSPPFPPAPTSLSPFNLVSRLSKIAQTTNTVSRLSRFLAWKKALSSTFVERKMHLQLVPGILWIFLCAVSRCAGLLAARTGASPAIT
jgi:hypothetical protein